MRKIKASEEMALARIEDSIPRNEIKPILERIDDNRVTHLISLLFDIHQKEYSLAELCRKSGIRYDELLVMLTRGRLGDGIERMSRHAPKVLEDIAIDAESTMVTCPSCKGSGEIVSGKGKNVEVATCPTCDGSAKLRKPGDVDARKLMLESLGLTNKNKGASVQVNVNQAGVGSVEDDLELIGEVIDVTAQPS